MQRCWVDSQCQGILLIWIIVGQGPIALGAGGGCLGVFSLIYHFSFLFPSLWETEILSQRAVKPKTTNQPTMTFKNNLVQMIIMTKQCVMNKNHVMRSKVYVTSALKLCA